jgi:hypothetical protein
MFSTEALFPQRETGENEGTHMTSSSDRGSRWRIVRDVVVFQVKCGLEAVLDLTLIPMSLAAAGLDLLVGNWRRPRLFHAVLRLGERCEAWIDLWGVAADGVNQDPEGVDAVMRGIEAVIRDPRTGPDTVRTLRRWAAMKLAGDAPNVPPQRPGRDDDPAS